MNKFHGSKKNKSFFEGWYFKHQCEADTIAFIPGINIDSLGKKSAFIQVITNENSYNINYDFSSFSLSKNEIKIGTNIFSDKRICVNIETKNLKIEGNVTYNEITPIKYDIMGPFSIIPFMECNHGVISLYHKLIGSININGMKISLDNGIGYIEKDWGTSFPKSYIWLQCNSFNGNKDSIMVSIADVPFLGKEFKGIICVVYYEGKEYRMATYNGVKLIKCSDKVIILKKGKYKLHIQIEKDKERKLLAPNKGNMSRIIRESAACNARFKFWIKDKLIFDLSSNGCGFEYVNEI